MQACASSIMGTMKRWLRRFRRFFPVTIWQSFAAGNNLARLMRRIQEKPQDPELLERADVLVTLLQMFPFQVNYWEAQNIFYALLRDVYPSMSQRADAISRAWTARFLD